MSQCWVFECDDFPYIIVYNYNTQDDVRGGCMETGRGRCMDGPGN